MTDTNPDHYTILKKLENGNITSQRALVKETGFCIMDRELGLVDDKLIAHFNEINSLYDIMRDIEWDAHRRALRGGLNA
jgi:hypothetical protein